MRYKNSYNIWKALGVLRMIKLFAWEPYVMNDITQRRDEELQVLEKQKILEIFLRVFAATMPMIAKVATFAFYVRLHAPLSLIMGVNG